MIFIKGQTKANMAPTVISFAYFEDRISVSLQSRLTVVALYSSVMANQTILNDTGTENRFS